MWFAIFITVLASTGNNVGKAIQKKATRQLPRFSLQPKILRQYLRSTLYLYGLAADLGGALLMIAAFALAPVSIVQPVSSTGLVTLAVFSHFYLKERLQSSDWGAVGLAALGTVGVGATSESDTASAPAPRAARIVAVMVLLGLAVAAAAAVQRRSAAAARRRAAPGAATSIASIYGLQAGACFGLSAASCRTGFLLARHVSWATAPLGLLCSVALTSTGFMLQTLGFKDGNTVVVCTCAAVSSMVSGVLVGLLALGETLPSSLLLRMLRITAWLLIVLGVSGLANGQGGVVEVLRCCAARIPNGALARLPSATALQLKAFAQGTELQRLPVTGPILAPV